MARLLRMQWPKCTPSIRHKKRHLKSSCRFLAASIFFANAPGLTIVLKVLLQDTSTMVIGSAVSAYMEVSDHQFGE